MFTVKVTKDNVSLCVIHERMIFCNLRLIANFVIQNGQNAPFST